MAMKQNNGHSIDISSAKFDFHLLSVTTRNLTLFNLKVTEKAMDRYWSNQKANSALKTKTGNKKILQIDKIQ